MMRSGEKAVVVEEEEEEEVKKEENDSSPCELMWYLVVVGGSMTMTVVVEFCIMNTACIWIVLIATPSSSVLSLAATAHPIPIQ